MVADELRGLAMQRISRRTFVAAASAAAAFSPLPQSSRPARAAAPPLGRQAPGFFRFKVGDFEVTTLHDGFSTREVEGYIRNVPLADVERALEAAFLPKQVLNNYFTTVVVNTGSKLVLIDSGFADNAPPGWACGLQAQNMAAAGIDPNSIDTVLVSHFHRDHINGLRLRSGDATFPTAEIMVPAREWAFWMDDARMNNAPEPMRPAFQVARRVFAPMAKIVKQYDWSQEVVPGITAMPAPGHTPGHTVFVVSSGSAKLLVLSDSTTLPHLFLRNPHWQLIFDMDPLEAEATRRRINDMAAADRMPVVGYHFPFPAVGHIVKEGNGYRLEPLHYRAVL
jgi:glyoxylase-like metal-dependent hydrolase (beta-lactamase superfamily II)